FGMRSLATTLWLGGVFSILSLSVQAQDGATSPPTIALTVDSGLSLRLIMTQKLRFKLNEPVRAKVTEPVFAFDREVISPGTEATGRFIGFRRPSRWVRAYSIMGGNFTPLREPQIEFDSIVQDGRTMALATDVTPGNDNVIRFVESKGESKGRIAAAKEAA